MSQKFDVVIIGGGLAGLTCAKHVCAAGFSCHLLEGSDDVGGRVRTDSIDGFLLDRGFQVFLTSYPEAQAVLDYDQLDFCRFKSGALVRYDGKLHRLADPWRDPKHLLATLVSPVGSLADKLRIARFRRYVTRDSLNDIYRRDEQSTMQLLRQRGFSDAVIDRFFRPFLGGVFLDDRLETSNRMCEFVFRMFSTGNAVLPSRGMGAIPQQLAAALPDGVVQLDSPVDSVKNGRVAQSSGETISARVVVIAVDEPAAKRLLGEPEAKHGRSVTNLYFAAENAPIEEPTLVLNGEGVGPINNLCVPSQVAPGYAPADQALLSVTVLGWHPDSDLLLSRVRDQLSTWFGSMERSWRHLKTYQIRYALPIQNPPTSELMMTPPSPSENVFLCGDYCDTASINGAMASGRRTAEAIMSRFAENAPN